MLSLEQLSDSIVEEAVKKHSYWKNGYAQLWSGWQFNISRYNCKNYRFCNYSLQEMIGSYAVMDGCYFFNCNLAYSRFNSAIANRSEFHNCILKKAYFSCARMNESKFDNCQADGSDFRMAKMNNTVMTNCSLTDSDFQDAELSGADLRFCNVIGCNFRGTAFDFSRKQPAYCYWRDCRGKTILLMTGYKDVYDVPGFMQMLDPMKLNAAYGISYEYVNWRIACL